MSSNRGYALLTSHSAGFVRVTAKKGDIVFGEGVTPTNVILSGFGTTVINEYDMPGSTAWAVVDVDHLDDDSTYLAFQNAEVNIHPFRRDNTRPGTDDLIAVPWGLFEHRPRFARSSWTHPPIGSTKSTASVEVLGDNELANEEGLSARMPNVPYADASWWMTLRFIEKVGDVPDACNWPRAVRLKLFPQGRNVERVDSRDPVFRVFCGSAVQPLYPGSPDEMELPDPPVEVDDDNTNDPTGPTAPGGSTNERPKMACCGKIGEVLKKIINAIKPILAIILVAVAIYFLWFALPGSYALFAGFEWLPAWITTMTASNTVWAYAALGLALVIDGEGLAEVAGGIADTVGDIAGEVVAGVTGGVVGGLFGGSNGLIFGILAALAVYFLFFRKGEDGKTGYITVKENFKDDSPPKQIAAESPRNDGFDSRTYTNDYDEYAYGQ